MEDFESIDFANANGILNCLRFLAQEAASLNLMKTLSAIEDALETVACESGMDAPFDEKPIAVRPVLH